MADQQQQPAIAAVFPAPPPFYHHFTTDNLDRLRQLRKEAARSQQDDQTATTNGDSTKVPLDILSLPPELRYLLPPAPPSQSTPYQTYGSTINHTAPDLTLSEAGIHQLYPPELIAPSHADLEHQNPQQELIALARSTLTTFLSLIGELAINPQLFEDSVENLQTLMYNLHDLVNRYRPHQARESLILMMEERVGRMREEVRRIGESKERVEGLLKGMEGEGMEIGEGDVNTVVDLGGEDVKSGGERSWKNAQESLWREMDEEMADVAAG